MCSHKTASSSYTLVPLSRWDCGLELPLPSKAPASLRTSPDNGPSQLGAGKEGKRKACQEASSPSGSM